MKAATTGERLLLSGVAGSVDGIGYVVLRVFTAHITGNTVHLGTEVGRLELSSAWRAAFAIAMFVVGVAVGALTREACTRHGIAARPVVIALTELLLIAFLGVGLALGRAAASGLGFAAVAAPAALAMGCQNAVLPRSAGRRVKTYVTGTMTEFSEAVVAAATRSGAERAHAARLAIASLGLWLTYLVGAIVSGTTGAHWGIAGALLPIAGVAIVLGMELWRLRAGEPLGSRVVA